MNFGAPFGFGLWVGIQDAKKQTILGVERDFALLESHRSQFTHLLEFPLSLSTTSVHLNHTTILPSSSFGQIKHQFLINISICAHCLHHHESQFRSPLSVWKKVHHRVRMEERFSMMINVIPLQVHTLYVHMIRYEVGGRNEVHTTESTERVRSVVA